MAMGSPLRTTMKNVLWSLYELNSIRANWNWFYKEDLLMIILFYLNQLNMSQNLMRILIYSMLICIFHWKKDKIISCPFYMWKFFDNKVNLIQQFIENLPLAACIFILVVFFTNGMQTWYDIHSSLSMFWSLFQVDKILWRA